MIKIYSHMSNNYSTRQIIKWMTVHDLDFDVIELEKVSDLKALFIELLTLTENGTSDLLAIRSQAYSSLNVQWKDIKISTLAKFVKDYPTLLRAPLVTDGKKLQVGFNPVEIRAFIPRNKRVIIYR